MPTGIYVRKKRTTKRIFSEKARENIRRAQIKKWQNPQYREMMSNLHKGYKMPQSQKEKIRESNLGKLGNFWKGGKIVSSQGYIFIYKPEHPYCIKRRYVLRSRLVMEKHLGRYLKPEEIVHHKGIKYPMGTVRNKQDDRVENLQLFANHSKHMYFHHPKGKPIAYKTYACCHCPFRVQHLTLRSAL